MAGFLRIFSKSHREARTSGDKVLRAVLSQARAAVFYTSGGVQDSVTGRFDLIALHAFLVMHAMGRDPGLANINQAFIDGLFATLDASYREAGISDPGMPRKMKQTASALYGRLQAYENGLSEGGPGGLEEALARNLYRGEGVPGRTVTAMAHYVIGSLGALAMMSAEEWKKGALRFAVPEFEGAQ